MIWPYLIISEYDLFNIGIKHDFQFINIRKVPREVLKISGKGRCWKPRAKPEVFQTLPRDLANVNEWQNHVWSLLHKFSENTANREDVRALYSLSLSLTYNVYLLARVFINMLDSGRGQVLMISRVDLKLSTCFAWRPGTSVNKVAKPCINSMWIVLLINGFLSVKTWLLITCGTSIYAIVFINGVLKFMCVCVFSGDLWNQF